MGRHRATRHHPVAQRRASDRRRNRRPPTGDAATWRRRHRKTPQGEDGCLLHLQETFSDVVDLIKIYFDFRNDFCVSVEFGSYAARTMFP